MLILAHHGSLWIVFRLSCQYNLYIVIMKIKNCRLSWCWCRCLFSQFVTNPHKLYKSDFTTSVYSTSGSRRDAPQCVVHVSNVNRVLTMSCRAVPRAGGAAGSSRPLILWHRERVHYGRNVFTTKHLLHSILLSPTPKTLPIKWFFLKFKVFSWRFTKLTQHNPLKIHTK